MKNIGIDALVRKIFAGQAANFRGNTLAGQVFCAGIWRIAGHGQHPAAGPHRIPGIDKIRNAHNVFGVSAFMQPVKPCDGRVQNPVRHITAHFLHAAKRKGNGGIVDLGEIIARVLADFPARAVKKA